MNKNFLKKIPAQFWLSLFLALTTLVLAKQEDRKRSQRILGLQTQLKADHQTIKAWEQILQERPDYKDGWVQLAALYYRIGDQPQARQALEKAKQLDPLNEIVLNFEKLLSE